MPPPLFPAQVVVVPGTVVVVAGIVVVVPGRVVVGDGAVVVACGVVVVGTEVPGAEVVGWPWGEVVGTAVDGVAGDDDTCRAVVVGPPAATGRVVVGAGNWGRGEDPGTRRAPARRKSPGWPTT